MEDYWSTLRRSARRLGTDTQSFLNGAAADFQASTRDAGQALRRGLSTAGEAMETAAHKAAGVFVDEPSMPSRDRANNASAPSVPLWRPTLPPRRPPRLEELHKGQEVFRKGAPANVVKIDNEADPPSLVVRMQDGGNEVGTDSAHVSLGVAASDPCLGVGVASRIVGLRAKPELNGMCCQILELMYTEQGVARWNVRLDDSGELVAVKPANLSVALSPPLAGPPPPAPAVSVASSSQVPPTADVDPAPPPWPSGDAALDPALAPEARASVPDGPAGTDVASQEPNKERAAVLEGSAAAGT